MAFIYLGEYSGKDYITEVNDEHKEYLENLGTWYLHRHLNANVNARRLYVIGYKNYQKFIMHRVIAKLIGIDCRNLIDHIDGNGLNNKDNNLRAATRSQNAMNHKNYISNTTGYPGVSFRKDMRMYVARIQINKRRKLIGFFHDPKEAHLAREKEAIRLFGEFYNPDYD